MNAAAADLLVAVVRKIFRISAKRTAQLAFFQNDRVAVQIDLEIVVLVDVKALSQLLRQDESAKGVDTSENSCALHDVIPPVVSILVFRHFPVVINLLNVIIFIKKIKRFLDMV